MHFLLSLNAIQYNQSRHVLSHFACEQILIRLRCVKKVRLLHTTLVPTHYMFLHPSVNVGIMARLTKGTKSFIGMLIAGMLVICIARHLHDLHVDPTTIRSLRRRRWTPPDMPPRNLNELRIALVSYWVKEFDILGQNSET